jgi:hypothetical protein
VEGEGSIRRRPAPHSAAKELFPLFSTRNAGHESFQSFSTRNPQRETPRRELKADS